MNTLDYINIQVGSRSIALRRVFDLKFRGIHMPQIIFKVRVIRYSDKLHVHFTIGGLLLLRVVHVPVQHRLYPDLYSGQWRHDPQWERLCWEEQPARWGLHLPDRGVISAGGGQGVDKVVTQHSAVSGYGRICWYRCFHRIQSVLMSCWKSEYVFCYDYSIFYYIVFSFHFPQF